MSSSNSACGPGLLLCLGVLSAGCHAAPRPAAAPSLPPLAQLRHDIDEILGRPALQHGYWGVLVRSLQKNDTLYSLNAGRLMMPASNMKIVTLAATAARLGWDYTYDTGVRAAGPIADGVLEGDLLVVGSGDPSLMDGDMAAQVFRNWAERLRAMGVRAIAGRIVGDDSAFDDEGLGFGWSWDDLPDDYAAGVSALQFNENTLRVTIAPGPAAGDPAGVAVEPAVGALVVVNDVTTGAPGSVPTIQMRRLPGSDRLDLRGSLPAGAAPRVEAAAVDNPTRFFVEALRQALIAEGIDVRGPAVDIDEVRDALSRDSGTLVATYKSPPLSTLATRLMKISQNLYAETFLKTLGAADGTPTAATGRTAVRALLQEWGVEDAGLIQRDGSGLSRYDYVTPATLVTILTHVDRDGTLREPFEAALPIAGRDGTLENRMKGTPADGNARAKSGSMSNVRSLSGYVTDADGEPLVFSIIANNFDSPPAVINQTTDAIVVRLATFRR